ncbi:MAG: DUF4397 domain-containing protein [Chloroflexota bacterium]
MKVRALVLAAATAALALSTLAGPASAAPSGATVWVAHGIPGVTVDVCVGTDEVKSNFKYGRTFKLDAVPAGDYTLKVYLAHAGTCKGTLVISKAVTLTDGLNATVVARIIGAKPGLQVFANDLSLGDAGKASVTVRHTATAPTVDVWVNGGLAPTVENLARGDERGPLEVPAGVYSWWVSGDGGYQPVIGPAVGKLESGTAYQILAVGTAAKNYRFIVIGQPAL